MLKKKDVMMSCWENHVMKNVKGKACLFKDGKPLDCLATPPKERYINSVDADLLCLGVFRRGNIENLWAHEGARGGACIDLGLDFE